MTDNDFVIEYACAKRMHQSFIIPATEARKASRVTYAIAGLENDDAPTIVFISGMYGMRWIALLQHHLALKIGVRLVCVDRPSFGGTTSCAISDRISNWLLTLPHLLTHLNCSNCIPIAASAGTIYLLNTLYQLPSTLPPNSPYAAILAPWVHPKQSNTALLSFVASDWMPKTLIEKHWDDVSGFFATRLVPSFAASGGLVESLSAASSGFLSGVRNHKKSDEDEDDEATSMQIYGMTRAQKTAVTNLGLKYMFAEETSGANDEALLCLKKGAEEEVSWGVCDDYASFVPKLSAKWRGEGREKLRMDMHFAASDVMTGEGGQRYLEECWGKVEGIDWRKSISEGTTHDSIGHPEKGVLESVLREARRCLEMG